MFHNCIISALQPQKIFCNKFQLLCYMRLQKSEVLLISNSYVVSLMSIKNLNSLGVGICSILFTAVPTTSRRLWGIYYISNEYFEQNAPSLIYLAADSSVIRCCFMQILLYN